MISPQDMPHNERAKIIAELSKRKCSIDEGWFKTWAILGRHVYNCTGKSIKELLES